MKGMLSWSGIAAVTITSLWMGGRHAMDHRAHAASVHEHHDLEKSGSHLFPQPAHRPRLVHGREWGHDHRKWKHDHRKWRHDHRKWRHGRPGSRPHPCGPPGPGPHEPPSGCSIDDALLSSLPCDEVVVSLPWRTGFVGGAPGLTDVAEVTLGLTMALPASGAGGFDAQALAVGPGFYGQRLRIDLGPGNMASGQNDQRNALGVGLTPSAWAWRVGTTVRGPAIADGSGEEMGLWIGKSQRDHLRWVVRFTAGGPELHLVLELDDTIVSEQSVAATLDSTTDWRTTLALEVDPATREVSALAAEGAVKLSLANLPTDWFPAQEPSPSMDQVLFAGIFGTAADRPSTAATLSADFAEFRLDPLEAPPNLPQADAAASFRGVRSFSWPHYTNASNWAEALPRALDLNGDGAPELLGVARETRTNSYGPAVLENDGFGQLSPSSGPFVIPTDDFSEYSSMGTTVFDLNRDGAPDLVSMLDPCAAGVYLSNPSGALSLVGPPLQAEVPSDYWRCRVRAGDFNGDGTMDLMLLSVDPDAPYTMGPTAVDVFLGHSGASGMTFDTSRHQQSPYYVESELQVDLDEDGANELVVGRVTLSGAWHGEYRADPGLEIWRSDSAGDVTQTLVENSAPVRDESLWEYRGMEAGDFNADGHMDIVAFSARLSVVTLYSPWPSLGLSDWVSPSLMIQVFLGDGTGQLQLAWKRLGYDGRRGPIVVDWDNDGVDDVVAPGFERSTVVYVSLGNGTFADPISLVGDVPQIGEISLPRLVADVDADGRRDWIYLTSNQRTLIAFAGP